LNFTNRKRKHFHSHLLSPKLQHSANQKDKMDFSPVVVLDSSNTNQNHQIYHLNKLVLNLSLRFLHLSLKIWLV